MFWRTRNPSPACSCSASAKPAHDAPSKRPKKKPQEKAPRESPMTHRCAILDDYQNVATKLADWSIPDVEVKVFNEWFADQKAAGAALKGFSTICMMRERTPFLKPTLEQL